MKNKLLVLIASVGIVANSYAEGMPDLKESYGGLSESMNWGDCFDYNLAIAVGICPGYPPYTSPMLIHSYWDLVALVEVTHDPWKSFFYDDSLYDFSSNSELSVAGDSVGGGYNNRRVTKGDEYIGEQRTDAHVWSISDIGRIMSSSPTDGCFSLVCKNEDKYYCKKVLKMSFEMTESMDNVVDSINMQETAEGKGNATSDGDTITYEDGSVYQKNEETGKFEQVREPGNYGAGSTSASGPTNASSSSFTGNDSAMAFQGAAASGMSSGGSTGGASGESSPAAQKKEKASSNQNINIPESTKKGSGESSEPNQMSSSESGSASQTGNDVMNNNAGFMDSGSVEAGENVKKQFDGIFEEFGSSMYDSALQSIDKVTYFSPTEMIIQTMATRIPLGIHPVYMTERHEKATTTGGFVMASVYQGQAAAGAGFFMPLVCAARSGLLAIGALGDMAGSSMLSGVSDFMSGSCIGSWGPLEPRNKMIGTGDHMMAAGISGVRALHVAQNLMSNGYNKAINGTHYSETKFNLDWPHQSKCYSFKGADALSRSWTSPVAGALDDVSGSLQSGNIGNMATSVSDATVDKAKQEGGYVFTYWRKRQCAVIWSCDIWLGDSGSI